MTCSDLGWSLDGRLSNAVCIADDVLDSPHAQELMSVSLYTGEDSATTGVLPVSSVAVRMS